ncbi:dolichol-phosphate mannosyltransferase subunit 3 [Cladochytrium replicatum]|nr:dolichol-phosphate mannosyltransferase subunit 3 [Cladochytrium replicatum]
MSKATRTIASTLLFATVWLVLLFHASVLPQDIPIPAWVDEITPVVPLWLLVAFGAYSLGNLGWALFTFRDCDDAHTSLIQEISQAKSDLRKRGVSID